MKNHATVHTKHTLLILGIIFVAFNLRPAITSVGPVVGAIRADLHLSNGMAGLITTLPLLAFAALSPVAPKIGQRLGNEMAILIGLIFMSAGIIVRSTGFIPTLFLGTAMAGIGIAVCNVLIPGIVKQSFPKQAGLMTGMYTTSMGVCAALASGMSIPLAVNLGLGWQKSLLVWAIFAVISLVIWLPQVRKHNKKAELARGGLANSSMLRSKLAWQVTLFMGLQSFLFYCLIAWLPEILKVHGMGSATGGWMLAVMQFAGLPASFLTPVLAVKLSDQRGIVLTIGALYVVGFLGLLIGGGYNFMIMCIILIGVAQGAGISLALTLFVLRSANSIQASALSGMAQSLGYLLAATGPIIIGFIFDFTHSWTMPIVALIFIAIAMLTAGLGAGRNVYVDQIPALAANL